MRDTAAIPTAVEFGSPAVPHVDVGRRIGGQHAHLIQRVVSPQNAVTSAYRAVTLRNLRRRSVDLEVNGAAMTRSLYHRSLIAPFLAGTESNGKAQPKHSDPYGQGHRPTSENLPSRTFVNKG